MKTSPLSDAEIARRLERDLPGWRHVDGAIRRRYRTGGWKSGLSLVAAIGALAEAADHHPDLLLRYADLEARLASHDAGGVTEKDIALARDIETLFGRDADPESATPDGG